MKRNTPFYMFGSLLVILGAYLLATGGSFRTQEKVAEIGSLQITASERHVVQPWMAGLGIVAGIGLLAVGMTRKAG